MDLIKADAAYADAIAPLIADFRVALRSYKGIDSRPDVAAAREEFLECLAAGWPVFVAEEGGEPAGYIVCRIEEPCLWVEHIYVRPEHRRKGAASLLFRKAEELAATMGEVTVFNYVHPNNAGMIGFLRSRGYTVLNMIEIRRPYRGEHPAGTIAVGDNVFDY